jgi:hypothetical protein
MGLTRLAKAQKEIALMPVAIRRDNEKALEYIQFMASRTNTDVKSWDVFDRFGGEDYTVEEDGNTFRTLLKDKREIGKVFFELIEEGKNKKKEEKKSILDEMPQLVEALEERMQSQLEGRKIQLKRAITQHVRNATNYGQRMQNEHANMIRVRTELEALEGGSVVDVVRAELEDCLGEGYWTNPVFDGGFLYLNTAANVVNAHKNKKANIDITVDLGQLAVKIDLNSFAMWVIPYKNNLRTQTNHYHPHVSHGRICWGDGIDQVHQWTKDLKLGSILKLLYSLLHNYSDDAPYCHLATFKRDTTKKYGRIAEEIKHPDRRPKPKKKPTPNLDRLADAPAEEAPQIFADVPVDG